MKKPQHDSQHPKSVLIADNDLLILEVVGDFLRASGFQVSVAHDGLEALELCRKERPDFVILDVVMPKIDGARTCWLIRQDPALRNTPIIAFSSLSPQDFRNFPELSADAYVAKGPMPITCEHIVQAIRNLENRERPPVDNGVVGYKDVRPRRMIQEMLDERRHYASVLRAIGAGVLELDPNGRIFMANPGACRILKAKEIHLVGEPLTSFVSVQDRKTLRDLFVEFAGATEPQQCRLDVRLGDTTVPLRLCAIIDGSACGSILVIVESPTPAV